MAKEYKDLKDFLLKESTIFDKEEDTNPLFYIWAVMKSVNGKTDEEIENSESLKALFKKLRKFCEKYKSNTSKLKKEYTPSEFLIRFHGLPTEKIRETMAWSLDMFIQSMTKGIQSFRDWREIHDDWQEFCESDEVKTVLSES